MLREMLRDGFGKDLKISGGIGNSINDLIVLEPQSAHDASWTEMEVARCIYKRLGWHWKFLERTSIEGPSKKIEKFSCEVKYAEGNEVVTEKRNFYFDISNVDLDGKAVTPVCGINLGAGTGMGLPYQLGWFHFDSFINNEPEYPGMGVTVAYGAPFTKATLYVYTKENLGNQSFIDSKSLENEFSSATRNFFNSNPDAQQIAERLTTNMLFRAFEIGTAYSIITLSSAGEHFFKLRVTLDPSNEKYTFDCMWESVNLILSIANPKGNK